MNSTKTSFFVIVLAACLTQFASDIYAPSLPAIESSLHTPIELVQWSMAIYMLGVALSQLIYGPLSEGIGRKSPMIIGFIIMFLGSFICYLSPTIQILILGRFIQGCGAGAGAALWRSVFRDIFSGEQLAKYSSYLVILIMFIIPAAPTVGAYLQDAYGWRANFLFLSIYGLIALTFILFAFKETNQHHHIDRLKAPYIIKTFRQLLTSSVFMGVTLCTFLSYGAFFAWFIAGPVLLIEGVGISPIAFGWITTLGGGSTYALAGWLNGRFVTRFGMPSMMRFGWSLMLFAGLLLLAGKFFIGMNSRVIVVPILFFYFGSTFIWPNAFATAFTPFGKIAGYAGSLYGSMQIGGGAVIGGIVSYLPHTDQLPLAIIIITTSILSWLIYEKIVLPALRNSE